MKHHVFLTIRVVLFSLIWSLWQSVTFAAENPLTACPSALSGLGCNLCFQSPNVYEGEGLSQYDIAQNRGNGVMDLYFQDELVSPTTYNFIGSKATYRPAEFEFPSLSFLSNCTNNGITGWCGDATTGLYTFLNPGEDRIWTQSTPGKHFQFVSLDKSNLSASEITAMKEVAFATKYTLSAWGLNIATKNYVSNRPQVVTECQYWGANFCGDGEVDATRETCDPNDPNKKNFGAGGCNSSCQPIPATATPICDALVANPNFGTSPFSSAVSCSGKNLGSNPSYKIDCGNGQVINASSGSCSYQNTTNLSITQDATCTITPQGGSPVTSNACSLRIAVNPANSFDLSLKKYVGTPGASTDAQTSGTAVTQNQNTDFSYIIRVRNEGTAPTSGLTTMTDAGPTPSGIQILNATGNGWNCAVSGNSISCTSNQVIGGGLNFSDIIVFARTSSATGTFLNTASVSNPNERSVNNFGNNNTDPAHVLVSSSTTACAIGTITLPLTSTITATTPGLCPAGQVVNSFANNVVGTTNNYVWGCGTSAVGGLCAASYTPTATACAIGNITLPLTSTITATTPGLCPAGQAVNGFTNNVVGTTNNYVWGCGTSAVGGLCAASFTPGAVTPAVCGTLISSVTTPQTTSSYSSTLTCTATAAAGASPAFQINCGNGQVINASTGTCNYTTFGTNAAFCSVNGQVGTAIPNSCRVNITSNPPGGGGGPGTCEQLNFSTVSNIGSTYSVLMACTATSAAGSNPTIEIDCGNGQTLTGSSGICNYSTGPGANFPYTATCRVNGSTQGAPSASPGVFAAGSCRQSIGYSGGAPQPPIGGGAGSSAYCGNGIVDSWVKTVSSSTQIPGAICTPVNRTETQTVNGVTTSSLVLDYYSCIVTTRETCDAGSLNGTAINNSICTDCNLNLTSTNPRANPLFISYYPVDSTRPRGLPVNNYQWIVGNNVPIFESGDRFAISSPFPTILGGYSATVENASPLVLPQDATVSNSFGNSECIGAGRVDFGSGPVSCTAEKTLFNVSSGGAVSPVSGGGSKTFLGNSSNITTAAKDVNPPLSQGSAVLQNNFTIGIGYLREPLQVRVSKQAVSNTAGGNAYIGTRVGYSVNAITNEFLASIQSGNFVVTSGSSTSDIALSGANESIGSKSLESMNMGNGTGEATSSAVIVRNMSDFNFTQFEKMGDAPNIFVMKKGKVTIDTNLRLKGVGLLLIEEGTLVINGNITYEDANSSWAFVVVKPDASTGVSILVKGIVETISGVYMALNGKMSGSATSIVQLSVDGNIYANISDLVNSRTFIRATEGSSALSTGVTINYSTRAFKNPPPLLSKYLEQYTLKKISR